MSYLFRVLEPTIKRYLKAFPAIGLTGPRQSGKSTLLRHILPNYKYITFDDTQNILAYADDPVGFVRQFNKQVIFDEVQHVPDIFHQIKIQIDNNRLEYGNFILTGSSQFKLVQHITESLAGRIGLLSLLPFQYLEMPKSLTQESIYQGSYPELVIRDYFEAKIWYGSYVETYLNKDVRALSNVGDLRDFRRFIQLLAANASQQLDMSSYSRDIGVSVPTIKRWLSILEASYIIFLIPPFYNNFGKRITKSPKVYFFDTGLISYFTGIQTFEQYDKGPLAGSLFENYVVSEIYKKELHSATQSDLYYYRTQDKAEIDLIIDRKQTKEFIEIKKNATFNPKMIQNLKRYSEGHGKALLLYLGEAIEHKNVTALPYWDYLSK